MISIIIPVYNCEKYIAKAIQSVLNQTFDDYEIIVVNDGSTDNTAKNIPKHPKIRYFFQENQGVSAARNYAIKQAKGQWIAFLDSDDLYQPEKLERQINYLKQNNECSICFCQYHNFTDSSSKKAENQQKLLNSFVNYFLPSGCFKRNVFEKYGYFDTNLVYGEDTEWINRILMLGEKNIAVLDDTLYFRRVHENNLSLQQIKSQSILKEIAVISAAHAIKIRKGLCLSIVVINDIQGTDCNLLTESILHIDWLGNFEAAVLSKVTNNDHIIKNNHITWIYNIDLLNTIKHANGDYLLIYSASAVIERNFAQKLLSVFENRKMINGVFISTDNRYNKATKEKVFLLKKEFANGLMKLNQLEDLLENESNIIEYQ